VDDMSFYRKQIYIICFISVSLLFSGYVRASECGVMQLEKNRSSGVTVLANNCTEPPYISIGTVFSLSAKGRLWLKSNPSSFQDSEFQMICQNRTGNTLQLEFSEIFTPWLSQTKLNNCSGWINNKLSCEGPQGEKNGMYCVLSIIKPFVGNQSARVERTTSVKMRDINLLLQAQNKDVSIDKNKILESIKAEIKLCKKLNGITENSEASWSVLGTEVENLEINSNNDPVLSECVETVITTFLYPVFSEKVIFKSTF